MSGFAPINDPKASKTQTTIDSLATFKTQMQTHRNTEALKSHLESQYSITIRELTPITPAACRVHRNDGPSWTARLFPAAQPLEDVEDEAKILLYLEGQDFPAERCAHPKPVSSVKGEAVLVTTFVEGSTRKPTNASFSVLGDLLGRLHKLDMPEGDHFRKGGAWHELCLQGGPREEIEVARSLVAAVHKARKRFFFKEVHTELEAALKSVDGVEDLPQALIHPAFVRGNAVIADGDESGDYTMVNWTGTGVGPRIFSLGWALWWAHELKRVQLFMKGYLNHVKLEPQELDRLADMMWARRLVLAAWHYYEGGRNEETATAALKGGKETAQRIAQMAKDMVKDMHTREGISA